MTLGSGCQMHAHGSDISNLILARSRFKISSRHKHLLRHSSLKVSAKSSYSQRYKKTSQIRHRNVTGQFSALFCRFLSADFKGLWVVFRRVKTDAVEQLRTANWKTKSGCAHSSLKVRRFFQGNERGGGPTAGPEGRNPAFMRISGIKKPNTRLGSFKWLREPDLNRRPSGYEPDELPDCSIPRQIALLRET